MLSNPYPDEKPLKTYKITDHLSVGLFNSGRIFTMVDGIPMVQCRRAILVAKDVDSLSERFSEYHNMDELLQSRSETEFELDRTVKISPEEELFAHASSIEAWVLLGYKIDAIDSRIAIPILKMLEKVDPGAKNALYFELASRWEEGNNNSRVAMFENAPEIVSRMLNAGSINKNLIPPQLIFRFIREMDYSLKMLAISALQNTDDLEDQWIKDTLSYMLALKEVKYQDIAYNILRKKYSEEDVKRALTKYPAIRAWRRFLSKEDFTKQISTARIPLDVAAHSIGIDPEFDAHVKKRLLSVSSSDFPTIYYELINSFALDANENAIKKIFGENFLRRMEFKLTKSHVDDAAFKSSTFSPQEGYEVLYRDSGLIIGIGNAKAKLPGGMKLSEMQIVAGSDSGPEMIVMSLIADLSSAWLYVVDDDYTGSHGGYGTYLRKLVKSNTKQLLEFVIETVFEGKENKIDADFYFVPMDFDAGIYNGMLEKYGLKIIQKEFFLKFTSTNVKSAFADD